MTKTYTWFRPSDVAEAELAATEHKHSAPRESVQRTGSYQGRFTRRKLTAMTRLEAGGP